MSAGAPVPGVFTMGPASLYVTGPDGEPQKVGEVRLPPFGALPVTPPPPAVNPSSQFYTGGSEVQAKADWEAELNRMGITKTEPYIYLQPKHAGKFALGGVTRVVVNNSNLAIFEGKEDTAFPVMIGERRPAVTGQRTLGPIPARAPRYLIGMVRLESVRLVEFADLTDDEVHECGYCCLEHLIADFTNLIDGSENELQPLKWATFPVLSIKFKVEDLDEWEEMIEGAVEAMSPVVDAAKVNPLKRMSILQGLSGVLMV